MPIVLIIIGALVGAATSEGTGVLLGGFVGWLFWRSLRQQREIDALRKRLEQAPSVAAAEAPPVAADGTVATDLQAAEQPTVLAADPAPAPTDLGIPEAQLPEPVVEPTIAAAPRPGAYDAVHRWLFGGNTIVKAGVGILFIGLAFLAKYASEHVTLPIEFRLAAIAATALVLLVLGWRLRDKRAGYAQVLQGGAVAVLYLTLFTAFRFYSVIGVVPAFVLMALVAALAAALAILQRAQALAAIGALGGFATPLLVSSGGGNHIGLFSYYLVLDLGIAAVAWWATWRWLNLIGFAFTFGVGTLWGLFSYKPQDYASAQAFLIVFFAVFVAILLLPGRRAAARSDVAEPKSHRWVNGSLLFGLPTVVFGLQYGLVHDTEYGVALSALLLAAFYVVLARTLHGKAQLTLAFEGSLAVGTVFLTLVIPFALEPRATAGAWALEGAGLVWLGWRQARRLPRAFGYALLVVAGFLLLYAIERHAAPTQLVNPTLLSGLMWLAGALIAAWVVQRHAATGSALQGEHVAEPLLIAWAIVAASVTAMLHVRALVLPEMRLAALIACGSSLAALLTLLTGRLAWRNVALPLLGFAPLLLVATALSADFQPQPFINGGWWAWPAALAVHAATLRFAAPRWPAAGAHLVHAVGALVLATLGAIAGRSLAGEAADLGSAWPWLGWLVVPALLLMLLSGPALLARWPLREQPRAYQRSAAGVLALAMVLWTLVANLVCNGAPAPLPYLPLLNPLDIGIAWALFAAWRWAAGDAGRTLLARHRQLPRVLLGGCGFVWLNAMLVRGFHHFGDIPFEVSAWSSSLAVQTGLTLLWTATALALMWWSARRGQRAPWMAGAALLALVVFKLLLVDLSGSGTVTRIVSFIGAGVLMLLIGFVAPLPGKEAADAKA